MGGVRRCLCTLLRSKAYTGYKFTFACCLGIYLRIYTNLDYAGTLETEVQKGLEHGSIAPRRKWTELIMTEGHGSFRRLVGVKLHSLASS